VHVLGRGRAGQIEYFVVENMTTRRLNDEITSVS
jgi:hypothetical protein